MTGHREFGAVIFVLRGVMYISEHKCMPFGSIASVHCWDRIGQSALLAAPVGAA